jgi:hypothetical protein
MTVRVPAMLVVAAVVISGRVAAQPDPTEKSEAAPEPAPEPKAKARAPEPPPEPVAEPAAFAWEPFGFLRLTYAVVQNDPNVAFVGRDDGFQLQNARVGVRGKYGARASFVVSIDGALDEREQINTPEGKLRVGLRDAFADVGLGGGVVVRGGFFRTLVDPDSLIPETARALVDRPLESRGVRATEGYETPGLTPGRSLGAALVLDPEMREAGSPRVGFELAVQNGADEYSSNNDNDKPAASAALLVRFSPPDLRHHRSGSWLVAAGRYNPRTVGDLPFRQDETDLQGSVGLQVAGGPIEINAGAIVQRTTFPTTSGPEQNAYGAHAQLMIHVNGGDGALPVALGYRFAILDPSSLITTDRVIEHTAGAVLAVPRYRMRVQLQVVHVAEQRELSNSRAQLAAELAL